MPLDDYSVPPRSWDSIEELCNSLREQFSIAHNREFPVIEFLENIVDHQLGLARFEVASIPEMGNAEGYTCPKGDFIRLREDVYVGACKGVGRDRFTAAHELGHFVMHTQIPLARATRGEGISRLLLGGAASQPICCCATYASARNF